MAPDDVQTLSEEVQRLRRAVEELSVLNDLARSISTSYEPDEIIQQEDMESTGAAIPLVRVLFPNLHPMLSNWDEY